MPKKNRILELSVKNLFRIFLDGALLAISLVLATVIRLEGEINSNIDRFLWYEQLFKLLPIVVLVQLSILIITGTYRRFWRYTSINDIIFLSRSLLISTAIIAVPRIMGMSPKSLDLFAVSYGVLAINFLIALTTLSSVRLLRYYLIEQRNIKKRLKDSNQAQKRTLIIGGGEAGIEVIKSIQSHPELGLKIAGILDDDIRKHGMNIENVKVLGAINDVKYFVSENDIDQLVIALPSLGRAELKEIYNLCSQTGADIRTIPSVDQLAGGHVTVEQIRKLSMEDLLGRDEIDLNTPEVLNFLKDKRVLVTGAGGSIGQELCLQLVTKCNISSICLLGKGENSVFNTLQSIYEKLGRDTDLEIAQKIADVKNKDRIDSIFAEFKPDIVFHAAAHKHVYLMELNACEAFENNVLGTKTVAEVSGKHKVEAFVLISTDKAVNPTSIMGSTKNLAEKATLITSKNFPETKFTAVRFGNVLGSRGSVIQVWEKQLASGQPITVTDKEAIRYFMTIPEASQLVIQASAKAQSGEVMLLDMGEPVKIFDLAQQFIQLSGFSLEDVAIEIIGLKPGEKLYEELLTSDEFVDSRLTDQIFKAKIQTRITDDELVSKFEEFKILAAANNNEEMKSQLRALLKELSLVKVNS
jgi:FlaA1/EpsC-like NDP-sugar epimerase